MGGTYLVLPFNILKSVEFKNHKQYINELKWPYELFGVECREGWKHLYQPITDWIIEYNKTHEDNPIEIHQIKESFGGLSYYVSYYPDELREMIREAEKKSYKTCETCGKEIDKPIKENGWIYTECKGCHKKWKEERELGNVKEF